MKVLVVDDDPDIRELVVAVCTEAGYFCLSTDGGEAALEVFECERPDLVVLDVMMPKVDGFEVCRRIRAADEDVPVLFLSAKGDITDKKIGFAFGCDDYLVKPFDEVELIIRIEALLRRASRRKSPESPCSEEHRERRARFALGPFEFDAVRHEVTKGGEAVLFTPKEFQLLHHLACHPGAVMSKDELIEALWGREYVDGAISIAVYVRKIREKIEENPAKPVYLKTVWGVGYSFEA